MPEEHSQKINFNVIDILQVSAPRLNSPASPYCRKRSKRQNADTIYQAAHKPYMTDERYI